MTANEPSKPDLHGRTLTTRVFSSYAIDYATTNPHGKDYARIDFFQDQTKVGQILFGSAIAPGSHASLLNADKQIHLYFSMDHFDTILTLLRSHQGLLLYVLHEAGQDTSAPGTQGGLRSNPPGRVGRAT